MPCIRLWAGAAVLAAIAQAPAVASDYPARPIRLVVGYTAGGGSDILARVLAQKMSEGLGVQVIVENRPGAASMIATEYVARAAPDGYTILLGASGALAINPALYKEVKYDSAKDFAPISLVASLPVLMAVNKGAPAQNLPDLLAYAKAHPEKANYSSAAAPFRLIGEQLNLQAGTRFQEILYKGSTDAVNAAMANDVLATISDSISIGVGIKSGKLKAIAITSRAEHPSFPGVPTFTSLGLKGLDMQLWQGLLAPAGTPPAIVERLQREVHRVIALPEVRQRYAGMGLDPETSTAAEFSALIASELTRWGGIVKAAGIEKL
ncbi:MAG: tripartite tricarboxylate transporter substrate binding protein [Pigmentiphaga sp.]|uniref:Bug family tripartite tricarboxylate transporter substrate binding protein n=1 Tax=Pigmentiphaga sp. TaxID=1977564 RepID=UPI0029A04FBD|nr:tripartite tricarboxylate transporter substrate binding protein [Pigmentiphaga sp.]MDX3906126.1 tripartite tricarboxylate transporter substrate binding protein [Pigmentiphaga sp.]